MSPRQRCDWLASQSGLRSQSSPRHDRPLRVERLEDRRLLAVVTVDTNLDTVDFNDGVTSLREAIFATNLVAGPDTIDFDAGLSGQTILLTKGELSITAALHVDASGLAGGLTINASGSDPTSGDSSGDGSRVFNISDPRGDGFAAIIAGLTLTGGDVAGNGGAILSTVETTLIGVTIAGNSAQGNGGGMFVSEVVVDESTFQDNVAGGRGGGIYSSGRTAILDSRFSGNQSFHDGGGVYTQRETTVTNSTFTNNRSTSYSGGGLFAIDTTLDVVGSTFSDNAGFRDGGGLFALNTTTTISDTTFTGNSAASLNGGGIWASGEISLIDALLVGNSAKGGGGIFARGGGLDLVDSTVSDNGALYVNTSTGTPSTGGGISVSPNAALGLEARIVNTTISGNSVADGAGGGLFVFSGLARLLHTTITDNEAPDGNGSGVASRSTPDVTTEITSSIVSGNLNSDIDFFDYTAGDPGINSFVSGGYNLVGSGSAIVAFNNNDRTGVSDPLLGPLQNNGGPTPTHALLPGSPALDGGDAMLAAGVGDTPHFDQRGAPFSRVFGTRIDLGALEQTGVPIIVDTLVDENDGDLSRFDVSLREAVDLANRQEGDDTILFDPILIATAGPLPATILLTQGELVITSSLTINGLGADQLIIDASGNDPTPHDDLGDGSRIFHVDDGDFGTMSNVNISGVTLTGGDAGSLGGAVYTLEKLSIADSVITDSFSSSAGGGIHAGRETSLTRVSVVGNRSGLPTSGRGDGGGLSAYAALTLIDTNVASNTASDTGGGVYFIGRGSVGASLTVINSTFSDNHSDRNGGGVFLDGSWNENQGTNTIAHATIVNNISDADGTDTGFGGGLFVLRGSVALDHTLLAQNTDNLGVAPDVTGLLGAAIDPHFSLIGDNRGSGLMEAPVAAPDANGNLIGGPAHGLINPQLGRLADNGGTTPTHALVAGSPALNGGDPAA